MNIQAYRDEILLKLTGYVLESEIVGTDTAGNKDYSTLDRIINSAFREIRRYYCSTRLATIPFSSCIDLSEVGVSSVSAVYRSKGYMSNNPQAFRNVRERHLHFPNNKIQWKRCNQQRRR